MNIFTKSIGTSILATEFFTGLFLLWLKSPLTTPELWQTFQKRISEVTHWKPVIATWKEKVIQLTLLLKTRLYPIPEAPVSRKATKAPPKVAVTQIQQDPKLEIDWDIDRLTELWFIMLDVLGNLQKIKIAPNHEFALTCLQETTAILLQTEKETLRFDEQPPLPVVGIFAPVLLESTAHLANTQILKGIQLAYTILGTLFCRQTTHPFEVNTISHYYRSLLAGLRSGNDSLISTIMNSNSNIFSLDLPGVNILIPDFLTEIDRIINGSMVKNLPAEVEAKYFTIVNSVIPSNR